MKASDALLTVRAAATTGSITTAAALWLREWLTDACIVACAVTAIAYASRMSKSLHIVRLLSKNLFCYTNSYADQRQLVDCHLGAAGCRHPSPTPPAPH